MAIVEIPTVVGCIKPNTPRYEVRLAAHDARVAVVGVELPLPSPALEAAMRDHAKKVYESQSWATTYNECGERWVANNYKGFVGEELLANHYGTHAQRRVGASDDGDIPVSPYTLDCKTFQGFLALKRREVLKILERGTVTHLALVQQRTDASPYIFCGVLPITEFLDHPQGFPFCPYYRARCWALDARALIPPSEFLPKGYMTRKGA